jgi:hypothetical protein
MTPVDLHLSMSEQTFVGGCICPGYIQWTIGISKVNADLSPIEGIPPCFPKYPPQ